MIPRSYSENELWNFLQFLKPVVVKSYNSTFHIRQYCQLPDRCKLASLFITRSALTSLQSLHLKFHP